MNIGITLASFGKPGNIPLLNVKFIRADNGTRFKYFHRYAITSSFALFKLKIFNTFRTSSGMVGDIENVFFCFFSRRN